MFNPQILPQPIGPVIVAVAGTPVPLTQKLVSLGLMSATDVLQVNKVFLNAIPTNNGNIYVGLQTMNKATLQGVIAVLVGSLGAWSIVNNVGLNVYQAHKWWVDADNAGEGLGGSVDQA